MSQRRSGTRLLSLFVGVGVCLFAARASANDGVQKAIHSADEALLKPNNHKTALALSRAVRHLGAQVNDAGTEARGLVRMGFANLHFADWGDDAGQWRQQAKDLIDGLPSAHIARAEVLMFEGYLSAMYFHHIEEGIDDLQKSITVGRALHDDSLLAKAFYLLGRVLPYDGQGRFSFECLLRSSRFARRAGLSRWEFMALRRAAMSNSRPDTHSSVAARLSELSRELGVGPAAEDLPAEQRVVVSRKLVTRMNSDFAMHKPVPLQTLKDGLAAAKFMAAHCRDVEDWEQWQSNLEAAEHAALCLQDESSVQDVYVERGAGLARQGKADEALAVARRFLDHKEKIEHYGELSRVYAYLAREVGKGGDHETAYKWFARADEYKTREADAWRASVTRSADSYFESELESRKLRTELQRREEKLAKSQARNTQLTIAATLFAFCIWFWQRARQHRLAQGQLQQLVDEQTESLRVAKECAEHANKAKTDFLARVNHELRNPLTALVSSCEILGGRVTDDPVATRCSETITACSLGLVDVIDDILDFTQIESGKLTLRESVFSPEDLMNTVRSVVQTKLSEQVELQVMLDSELPGQVKADEAKLRQILINLGLNSARHTDEGHVRFECRLARPAAQGIGSKLVLTVVDTGVGMSETEQASVFSQYTTHSKRSNTGLGLYISRAFVDCMGGRIECSSVPGQGTTFVVEVPFDVVAGRRPARSNATVTTADSGLSILVVDDEPLNRETVEMLLEQLGHRALTAENWAGASEALASEPVDIVLLDLQMPEMTGYQMLPLIKEFCGAATPTVIALTGDATNATRQRTLAAGFSGFLAKPFRIANLAELLETRAETRAA